MGEEPLEEFYGYESEEAERLAGAGEAEPEADPAPSGDHGLARWMGPGAGAIVAGIALGLRDVFEPEHRDRIAVEQPAPAPPEEPQRYEVHLDPDVPEDSYAIYRPWMQDAPEEEDDASGAPPDRPEGTVGGLGG